MHRLEGLLLPVMTLDRYRLRLHVPVLSDKGGCAHHVSQQRTPRKPPGSTRLYQESADNTVALLTLTYERFPRRIVTVEAVAAQQRQQQAVADFEAGRVTAAQAAASAEAPATGTASQDQHGAAAHATDASVPMAIASSCRRVLPLIDVIVRTVSGSSTPPMLALAKPCLVAGNMKQDIARQCF